MGKTETKIHIIVCASRSQAELKIREFKDIHNPENWTFNRSRMEVLSETSLIRWVILRDDLGQSLRGLPCVVSVTDEAARQIHMAGSKFAELSYAIDHLNFRHYLP